MKLEMIGLFLAKDFLLSLLPPELILLVSQSLFNSMHCFYDLK